MKNPIDEYNRFFRQAGRSPGGIISNRGFRQKFTAREKKKIQNRTEWKRQDKN